MNSLLLNVYYWISIFLPETRLFGLKKCLLKIAGVQIGKNVRICSSARFLGNGHLKIGDNCWIGPQTLISVSEPATLNMGSNIDIAPRVFIGTGSHNIDMEGFNSAGNGISLDINIEDGVWLGAGAMVLPGVSIGKKSIIGASSVVNCSIAGYCIAVGNPCKPIKRYNIQEKKWEKIVP